MASQRVDFDASAPPAIELDPAAHAAMYAGRRVRLSRREFALLQVLVANASADVGRDRIAAEVWNGDCATNVVDVYVGYLRRKLGDNGLIRTVRGVGYRLELDGPARDVQQRSQPLLAGRALQAEQLFLQPIPIRGPNVEPLPGMIGDSPAMRRVYRLARIVAPRVAPVLITGATGTGKELVARAIHDLSPRSSRPMVTINCAAIPETLIEAELFGYTRGAFTGAIHSQLGRIHAAHGGTLFLDEIGELARPLQAKLLRFLESGELQRLGSPDVFRIDVRLVAASNADLQRKMRAGEFRDDLYYRLAVFPIPLPALAVRVEDVVPLARHFLSLCDPALRLDLEAERMLRQRAWPGNVRELRHVVERGAILAAPGKVIEVEHLLP